MEGDGFGVADDGVGFGEEGGEVVVVFDVGVGAGDVDILGSGIPIGFGLAGEACDPEEIIEAACGGEVLVHIDPKVFEGGWAVFAPPEPGAGELVEGAPEDGDVAVSEVRELIGYAGQVALHGIVLGCAGAEGGGKVEVLFGVFITGADVGGSPVPAEGGDTALFEVPTGGVVVDEGALVGVDVVEAEDGGLFAGDALQVFEFAAGRGAGGGLLAGEGFVAVDVPKIAVELLGAGAGLGVAEVVFVVEEGEGAGGVSEEGGGGA